MSRTVNFLRGWTALTVTGVFPERMLNLCAQQRVPFWALEWVDSETFRFRVPTYWVGRLQPLAERTRCTLCQDGQAGLPAFLWRFRHRYAFLVGLLLSVVTVCLLSNFILSVDIEGCQTVSQAEILMELKRLGVYPGAYGPAIDGSAVGQQALVNLTGLSWMSVNIKGTRAEIIVREATPPPELVDESVCTDVVAAVDGVISRMEVLAGQPMFQEGDAVLAGEVLIAGMMKLEGPQYSDIDLGYLSVHGAGNVWAETRRTLTASIPLKTRVKRYTGEESVQFALNLLGRRVNFYQNSGMTGMQYDKISKIERLTLPGGRELPISLLRTTCRAYEAEETEVDRSAAQALLEERLLEEINVLIGEDGRILEYESTVRETEGTLAVTVKAACREQIGRTAPSQGPAAPPEEGASEE